MPHASDNRHTFNPNDPLLPGGENTPIILSEPTGARFIGDDADERRQPLPRFLYQRSIVVLAVNHRFQRIAHQIPDTGYHAGLDGGLTPRLETTVIGSAMHRLNMPRVGFSLCRPHLLAAPGHAGTGCLASRVANGGDHCIWTMRVWRGLCPGTRKWKEAPFDTVRRNDSMLRIHRYGCWFKLIGSGSSRRVRSGLKRQRKAVCQQGRRTGRQTRHGTLRRRPGYAYVSRR